MGTLFGPVRALLQECLEYPGQSYGTIATVVGCNHRSMVRAWIDGRTTPRRRHDWPRIRERARQHLTTLRSVGADHKFCDEVWRSHFNHYLAERRLTPEAAARNVGMTDWQGRRWTKFGEIPHDAARPAIERETGFDFTISAYRRAVAAARAQLGCPFPPPLDAVEMAAADSGVRAAALHNGISAAIAEARKRGGITIAQFARKTETTHPCASFFSAKFRGRNQYSAGMLATLIASLARYLSSLPTAGSDPIVDALALLQQRPPPPKGVPCRHRTTVRWDRIEATLRRKTLPLLRYRCPNGEPAAVMLVRFCIGCEQSRKTTRDLIAVTGIKHERLSDWLNGRAFPDYAMRERLQRAVERLNDHAVSAASAAPTTRAESTGASAPRPAALALETELVREIPTNGAADILVGVASTVRGLRAMHRAGWRPDTTAREHLIAIATTVMEVGGLTPADLQPKSITAAPDDRSPAVAAFREIAPNLRSRSGRSGGTRRP